jgi:acyl carrier protein
MSGESTPRQSALRERLLPVWREVLSMPNLNADDDFFEVGGHSMLALRLVARINDELELELGLLELYEHASVVELADWVANQTDAHPGERDG